MPTLADLEAARPKCPHPMTQTLRNGRFIAAQCGRPMRWFMDDDSGRWVCPAHGQKLTGRDAAERAGTAGMRWEDDAA